MKKKSKKTEFEIQVLINIHNVVLLVEKKVYLNIMVSENILLSNVKHSNYRVKCFFLCLPEFSKKQAKVNY